MAKPEPKAVSIVYVGPHGHESATWGPLEPGERYQTTEDFAAYLTSQHPEFWQRPVVKTQPSVGVSSE